MEFIDFELGNRDFVHRNELCRCGIQMKRTMQNFVQDSYRPANRAKKCKECEKRSDVYKTIEKHERKKMREGEEEEA